jgi:3-phosphoshikimate 1-carboxyvinyltransferase
MQVKIIPSIISGTVLAAASKSAMQRACALALLQPGETIIHNPGQSNDDKAALSIIENLGAVIEKLPGDALKITGNKTRRADEGSREINCGESGLSIRMFAPIAALNKSEVTVTGSGSLLTRPMDFFDTTFPQLGVKIRSNEGKLPLVIHGPLQPKNITVDGSLSSQFLTGLLIAFAEAATEPVTITVTDLKSKPYIDLTLQMMDKFGYKVVNKNYEQFIIEPSTLDRQPANPEPANPQPTTYTVEGDWSGAAFLLVAGAIAGKITVKGLDVFSAQADKAILQALMMTNAIISITPEAIVIEPAILQPFHFDATDCPDLFPPLVALAAYCQGVSVIEGVSRLAHKESNRALTLQEEFGKMGVEIKLQDDLMIIEGGGTLNGASMHSHHDHRIAMAAAVAGLRAVGDTTIDEAEAINKSYPAFYDHLKQLGAAVNLNT